MRLKRYPTVMQLLICMHLLSITVSLRQNICKKGMHSEADTTIGWTTAVKNDSASSELDFYAKVTPEYHVQTSFAVELSVNLCRKTPINSREKEKECVIARRIREKAAPFGGARCKTLLFWSKRFERFPQVAAATTPGQCKLRPCIENRVTNVCKPR